MATQSRVSKPQRQVEKNPQPPQARPSRRSPNVGELERWLSMIGGGAAAIYGLRRSFGSLLLALGGGALIYRGFTGHCALYKALEVNTADPEAITAAPTAGQLQA